VSPYSTGLPGASLTSTSIDPFTEAAPALWDEEELMFDEIANPPKGKGKEKDVGKRRAYVRVVTNLGGGSLNLELYCEKVTTCFLLVFILLKYSPGTENMLQFLNVSTRGQV
jgi:peptidyl-prolyl cis-trans isomerase-like 2